jgi:hypothetical protein
MENNDKNNDQNNESSTDKEKSETNNKIEEENDKVYFIVSFKENDNIELTLSESENYNLEKIPDKENNNIIIYYFMNKEKKKKVTINTSEKDISYELEIKDETRNYFDYDFQLKDNSNNLSDEERFKIYYSNFFKDKEKNSKEFEDFIYSSQLVLKKKDGYLFSFYILIFNEIYNTKFAKDHLTLFDIQKIQNFGELSNIDKDNTINIFNSFLPKSIIIEDEKKREEITDFFYGVLLFFNLECQPDKVIEMCEDESIK